MTTNETFDYLGTVELAYALLDDWKQKHPYARDRFPRYALFIDGQFSFYRFNQYLNAVASAYEKRENMPVVVECQSYAEFIALLVKHNVSDMILKGKDNFATDPWTRQQMKNKPWTRGYR